MSRRKISCLFRDMEHIDMGTYEDLSRNVVRRGLFLDELNETDIRLLLDRCGLMAYLRKKSIDTISLTIFTDEGGIDHLALFDQNGELIIDLRLSKKRYVWTLGNRDESFYDMIVIEWLSTRDPDRKEFPANRPQLPGQIYPGLGCLGYLLKMMALFSRKTSCDGFLDVPDHLHLSVMYSRSFFFLDPAKEGKLRSLLQSLRSESLDTIAWAAVTDAICEKESGEIYSYTPSEQLFPVSRRLKSYFLSAEYTKRVKEYMCGLYVVDHDKLTKEKKKYQQKTSTAEER